MAPDPRLFALPPGVDFPAQLVAGLTTRFGHLPPQDFARIRVIVNTRRMQRRVVELLSAGPARLLPRVQVLTDLGDDPALAPAYPVSPLRQQLELTRLIAALIARQPALAAGSSAFALAESLAALMAEIADEGVDPARLAALDVGHLSLHWQQARSFLQIVIDYLDNSDGTAPSAEVALYRAVAAQLSQWSATPPDAPVILAGSTGSRGTTQRLMQGIARLPGGHVVLPGFDFAAPDKVWQRLQQNPDAEDHPQYRLAALLQALQLAPGAVARWTTADPAPARNRLVSLALRPAPVTGDWLHEGARLSDIADATAGLTLLEAADPRQESLAIALALRDAVGQGRTAALITPDRTLARRVTAALDRWQIVPDDSGGRPLALSPPGRFLRQVAQLLTGYPDPSALVALLKHPLCHSGADRGPHLRHAREFELFLRRNPAPLAGPEQLNQFAARTKDDAAGVWAQWLAGVLAGVPQAGVRGPGRHLAALTDLARHLAAGAGQDDSGALWDAEAGAEARAMVDDFTAHADACADIGPGEFARWLDAIMAGYSVRPARQPGAAVSIWGTLEARVQGADVVVLGGLNEGIWPAMPPPDPWLNRDMRRQAGLLSPDRRIGLAGHDFQQAIATGPVILSRAARDADSETVMSRWLNRLTNLLQGLPDQGGAAALDQMRNRGRHWTGMARALDSRCQPVPPAPRPAPQPPVAARPRRLSVTRIQTLIRDPYAIYAQYVLKLHPLDRLTPEPTAMLRGNIIHEIVERFLRAGWDPTAPGAEPALFALADGMFASQVPWPSVRAQWRARFRLAAEWFLETEPARRALARPEALEVKGLLDLADIGFTLSGKADRIDRTDDGSLIIYDYKSGAPPSKKQVRNFDRQLMLEAVMAESGAFSDIGPALVSRVAHIGLGTNPKEQPIDLRCEDNDGNRFDPDEELEQLRRLISAFLAPDQGFAARRAMESMRFEGDFDHLARYGEWDASDQPQEVVVG